MAIVTFGDLLEWLVGAGGAFILISWTVSWGLEEWQVWVLLASRMKSIIILLASVALGLVATYVRTLPAEFMTAVAPYAQTVIVVVVMWLTTQTVHKVSRSLER